MSRRAYWRLTLVFLVVISVWLLWWTIYHGSVPPPLTELRFERRIGEGTFSLPVALPFWRDLLAAPLISGLVAAAVYSAKKIDGVKDKNIQAAYGYALMALCAITFLGAIVVTAASNAGLLISLAYCFFCAVALIGGIVLGIKVIRYLSQWVFEP